MPNPVVDQRHATSQGESESLCSASFWYFGMQHAPGEQPMLPAGLALSFWPFSEPEFDDSAPAEEQKLARRISQTPAFVRDQATLHVTVVSLAGGLIVLLGLFAVTIRAALSRVLRPVEAIRREVDEITEHDLARRVSVPRTRDEIARLATTMNRTLERLHTAVETNRRFAADASHELRSPLAALRAELEIAQAHPEKSQWRQVIDDALSDTRRLEELTDDLLLLTSLDNAITPDEHVDLTTVVAEETARILPAHVTLTAQTPNAPVQVHGRRALLVRLLGNLLDNAERYANHQITVRLTTNTTTAVLEVSNDGPEIPSADRERIFDRFTRLDDARTRGTGGTGLGLSIAHRIATAHHGTIHATNSEGCTTFITRIPLATARP
ncbi:HAMP domain-containing sensor histidine kinase [Kibdelosporangium aridum]|nr:HAMP domain-containing sensor histidine kinase [Kibdelosporangium aridum]